MLFSGVLIRLSGSRNIQIIHIDLGMRKIIAFFLVYAAGFSFVSAQQEWPFYSSIEAFKKQDSIAFPEKGGILFVGSSSIRRWDDLKDRFNGYHIIQRGFGGSEYKDIVHYSEDIIFPYRPSKIFLYAGENDFARGRTVDEVYNTVLGLYSTIRERLPETLIYIISVKPSEKLIAHSQSISALNDKLKQFIDTKPGYIKYVDIYSPMLNEKKAPRPELFVADKLHLSSSGYAIWETAIRKLL